MKIDIYLNKYQPILNVLKSSNEDPRKLTSLIRTQLTRFKISESLKGRKDSEVTLLRRK